MRCDRGGPRGSLEPRFVDKVFDLYSSCKNGKLPLYGKFLANRSEGLRDWRLGSTHASGQMGRQNVKTRSGRAIRVRRPHGVALRRRRSRCVKTSRKIRRATDGGRSKAGLIVLGVRSVFVLFSFFFLFGTLPNNEPRLLRLSMIIGWVERTMRADPGQVDDVIKTTRAAVSASMDPRESTRVCAYALRTGLIRIP